MISTIVVSAIAAVVSIGLLIGGTAVAFTYIRANAPVQTSPPVGLEVRVSELEVKIQSLPSLWEEERKRAKRSQQAAEAARRSTDEKLEEIEALISEGADVSGEHEEGVHILDVQPVRKNMGVPATPGVEDRLAAVAHLLT